MSQDSLLAQVSAAISKDELAALGASDDRELMAAGKSDFLPYEFAFDALFDVVEVKGKKEYDSRGVFVKLDCVKVYEAESPKELKAGTQYTLGFFDVHPKIPPYVIGQQILSRRAFAATIAQVPDNDSFKAAPVLVELHKEVEPLGIRMRIRNVFDRTTRTGKKVHKLEFELVK